MHGKVLRPHYKIFKTYRRRQQKAQVTDGDLGFLLLISSLYIQACKIMFHRFEFGDIALLNKLLQPSLYH